MTIIKATFVRCGRLTTRASKQGVEVSASFFFSRRDYPDSSKAVLVT